MSDEKTQNQDPRFRSLLMALWIGTVVVAVFLGMGATGDEAAEHGADAEPADAETRDASSQGSEVLAMVGQVPLLRVELDALLAEEGFDPQAVSEAERAEALKRLVENELWLQTALEDGRLQDHRALREAVTRRMLDVIFPVGSEPEPGELEELYRAKYGNGADGDTDGQQAAPPLEKVRFRLMEEWRRQRNQKALDQYLAWLKRDVEVTVPATDDELKQAWAELESSDASSGGVQ